MKYIFKTKGKTHKKILSKIVFLTITLIMTLTFFLLIKFNKEMNNNLITITSATLNQVTYSLITTKINHSILNKDTLKDILIINKNSKDEILFVDFNLDKAYIVLDNISSILTNSFTNLSNGNIDIAYLDKNLSKKTAGVILNIPLGSTLKSNYFYNLGPKIPVKINFIGSVLTNLETKITNYGFNNALVEVFVYIEFISKIITPFQTKDITLKYNAVISSLMINGSVPSFYNGVIETKTPYNLKNIE